MRYYSVYHVCFTSLMCVWVWFFFFFKQKTAYEMRISDWSSDVCSSDLRPGKLGGYGEDVLARLRKGARSFLERERNATAAISGMALGWDTAWALAALDLGVPLTAAVPFSGQEK